MRWLIAWTPLLSVAVLFTWHPRTWLATAGPGEVDPALVAVIAAVMVALAVGAVLARVDSIRLRDTGRPLRWQWALLGAPVYLGAVARWSPAHGRWPALVSSAVVLLGVTVAAQKLLDAGG